MPREIHLRAFVILSGLVLAGAGGPLAGRMPPSRPDRSAAAIEELRAQLRTANSATAVLDRWCASHFMAPAGAVVAEKLAERGRVIPRMLRTLLRVGPREPIRYRHVRLRCADHVLSEAMLWYVPGRLPGRIDRQLRETGIPFGRAVAPLQVARRPLAATSAAMPGGSLPASLFDQVALLILPNGAPIAYVREAYLPGVLEFPVPPSD